MFPNEFKLRSMNLGCQVLTTTLTLDRWDWKYVEIKWIWKSNIWLLRTRKSYLHTPANMRRVI